MTAVTSIVKYNTSVSAKQCKQLLVVFVTDGEFKVQRFVADAQVHHGDFEKRRKQHKVLLLSQKTL